MPDGVLVLHGFTGNPTSMAGLARAFADAGFDVEMPTLPGHGTVIEDMIPTRWADWVGAALAAYDRLVARLRGDGGAGGGRVLVAGLSMGGGLACRVAVDRPGGVAGLVVVNPIVEPPGDGLFDILRLSLEQGIEVSPGIGSDIARPGRVELAYAGSPLAPALSMYEGIRDMAPLLPTIECPVLLFNSPQDHVVPPSNSDYLATVVSGPVERVTCERSYHVATMDWDAEEIESRSVDFARKLFAS